MPHGQVYTLIFFHLCLSTLHFCPRAQLCRHVASFLCRPNDVSLAILRCSKGSVLAHEIFIATILCACTYGDVFDWSTWSNPCFKSYPNHICNICVGVWIGVGQTSVGQTCVEKVLLFAVLLVIWTEFPMELQDHFFQDMLPLTIMFGWFLLMSWSFSLIMHALFKNW